MKGAIGALADSFRAISVGGPSVALRGDVLDAEREARGLMLGSYIGSMSGVCFNVIGNWQGRRGGLIAVFDTAGSRPELLLSATYVTVFRTGAASGAATKQLARPDSRRLAILGTGRQSTTQLQAVLAVRPIERVAVWNRTEDNAVAWIESTREMLGPIGPELELAPSAEEACREADIVVVSIRSSVPVLHGEWLRPGAHVNGVGASTPHQRELALSVLQRAEVKTVDSRELALQTGDFLESIASNQLRPEEVAEMGELLLGRLPGRTDDRQITLFKSVGHAANDLAIARWLAEEARRAGLGTEVAL